MTKAAQRAPKEASVSVVAGIGDAESAAVLGDNDFDDASPALSALGKMRGLRQRRAGGLEASRLTAFLPTQEAPATVDPSLWRQSRLNMNTDFRGGSRRLSGQGLILPT